MSELNAFAFQVVQEYLSDSLDYSRVYEDEDIIDAELDDDELAEVYRLAQGYLDQVSDWFEGLLFNGPAN